MIRSHDKFLFYFTKIISFSYTPGGKEEEVEIKNQNNISPT